jgi:hypothetical protein
MPVSVAAAHYFSTADGKGDETYEVVLRNFGATSVELSARTQTDFLVLILFVN